MFIHFLYRAPDFLLLGQSFTSADLPSFTKLYLSIFPFPLSLYAATKSYTWQQSSCLYLSIYLSFAVFFTPYCSPRNYKESLSFSLISFIGNIKTFKTEGL